MSKSIVIEGLWVNRARICFKSDDAAIYQAIGSQVGTSNVCITLAQLAAAKGDLQSAAAHLQPAADFGKSIGHPLGDQLQAQIDAWRAQLDD